MASSDSDSDSSSRIDDVQPVAAAEKSKKKAASKGKAKAASKTVDKSAAMITSSDDESSSSDDEPAAGDVSVVRIAKELRYKAPRNMMALTVDKATSTFDFDRLAADPKLELWAIRIPDGLKSKNLANIQFSLPSISAPSSSSSAPEPPTGSLTTKHASYTLYNASSSEAGGDELSSLRPLLPRRSKGGYFLAPRPISTHLVLAQAPTPSASTSSSITSKTAPSVSTSTPVSSFASSAPPPAFPVARFVPPVKPPRKQPMDKLLFRNFALGTTGSSSTAPVSVKEATAAAAAEAGGVPAPVAAVVPGGEEKKGKKRKVGEALPAAEEGGAAGGEGDEGEKKKKKKKKDA